MSLKIPLHKNSATEVNKKNVTCVNIKGSGYCEKGAECPFRHPVRQMCPEVYLDHLLVKTKEQNILLAKIAAHLEKQTIAITKCADTFRMMAVNTTCNKSERSFASDDDQKKDNVQDDQSSY